MKEERKNVHKIYMDISSPSLSIRTFASSMPILFIQSFSSTLHQYEREFKEQKERKELLLVGTKEKERGLTVNHETEKHRM